MFQAEGGAWQWCCLPGAADMGTHSPGAESVCVCVAGEVGGQDLSLRASLQHSGAGIVSWREV